MNYKVLLAVMLISIGLAGVAAGQGNDVNSAAVDWKRYQVSRSKHSFMMPKLPVMNGVDFACDEKRGTVYYAYANQAVYEFRYYVKQSDNLYNCTRPERFPDAMDNRLDAIRAEFEPGPKSETDGELNGRKVKIFRWEGEHRNLVRWVFTDTSRKYWIELSVGNRPDVKPETERFLNSLGSKDLDGIELKGGAARTLGDLGESSAVDVGPPTDEQPMILFGKPKAIYTDKARRADTQGIVTLRVVFLANGAIGDISVVKGLPNGLTEQAIEAARRMVFLPSRIKGVPRTTSRPVTYTFNIY